MLLCCKVMTTCSGCAPKCKIYMWGGGKAPFFFFFNLSVWFAVMVALTMRRMSLIRLFLCLVSLMATIFFATLQKKSKINLTSYRKAFAIFWYAVNTPCQNMTRFKHAAVHFLHQCKPQQWTDVNWRRWKAKRIILAQAGFLRKLTIVFFPPKSYDHGKLFFKGRAMS